MWSTLIAVLGTLAAGTLTPLLQHRTTRTADHRRDVLTALRELTTALDAHRRAMWVREEARLTGAPAEKYATLRAESHATRTAISAPLVTVRILAPDVADQATAAAEATYALRGAPDRATLDARRTDALTAVEALIESVRLT